MAEWTILPEQQGYEIQYPAAHVIVPVEGGFSRSRLDVVNPWFDIRVRWAFDRTEFESWRTFYRDTINEGGDSFTMQVILLTSDLALHECQIKPGTLKLSSQTGNLYIVSATLEVNPTPEP